MESAWIGGGGGVSVSSSGTMFAGLVVPALVLWYVHHRLTHRRFYELAAKIPGPTTLPIIGNCITIFMASLFSSNHQIFKTVYSYSFEFDLAKIWVGPRLAVFLTNPKDVEVILESSLHIDKSPEYSFFKPWLGNGLLISTGDKWRAHRKLIAPTFHLNVLKSFLELFNANSRDVVEKLRKEADKQFDCHDYMSESTVEMLLETVMGVNKKTQEKSGFDYAMAVMKMCNILHLRHYKVWLRPDFLFGLTKHQKDQDGFLDTIHGLTKKVIQVRKEEYATKNQKWHEKKSLEKLIAQDENVLSKMKSKVSNSETNFSYGQSSGLRDDLDVDENDVGEKKRSPFLEFMLECAHNGVVLTDEDVRDQVNTIMFEGHDTTAAASSFFLCMMAARPDIQENCIHEIDAIFGDSDRPCTFQDTQELKYLERCIMETLRMYPPVPIIARQTRHEQKLASCDVIIPANTTVILGIFKVHRRHDIYPNPDVFDPDNFLPEKSASRHYYSFIPFSAGPRSCVGRKYAMLKLKVLLSTILRNFTITGGQSQKDWKLQGDIILKRTDGFNITMTPRLKHVDKTDT